MTEQLWAFADNLRSNEKPYPGSQVYRVFGSDSKTKLFIQALSKPDALMKAEDIGFKGMRVEHHQEDQFSIRDWAGVPTAGPQLPERTTLTNRLFYSLEELRASEPHHLNEVVYRLTIRGDDCKYPVFTQAPNIRTAKKRAATNLLQVETVGCREEDQFGAGSEVHPAPVIPHRSRWGRVPSCEKTESPLVSGSIQTAFESHIDQKAEEVSDEIIEAFDVYTEDMRKLAADQQCAIDALKDRVANLEGFAEIVPGCGVDPEDLRHNLNVLHDRIDGLKSASSNHSLFLSDADSRIAALEKEPSCCSQPGLRHSTQELLDAIRDHKDTPEEAVERYADGKRWTLKQLLYDVNPGTADNVYVAPYEYGPGYCYAHNRHEAKCYFGGNLTLEDIEYVPFTEIAECVRGMVA